MTRNEWIAETAREYRTHGTKVGTADGRRGIPKSMRPWSHCAPPSTRRKAGVMGIFSQAFDALIAAKDAEIAKLKAELVDKDRTIASIRGASSNPRDQAEIARLLAEVERLQRVEEAARDMLNFGSHDGPCSHDEYGGYCLLHVVTSKTREKSLRAALDAAEGGST